MPLLAPQSGALRISAYRDFHPSNPIHPLIAFEHLSLSMVIRNSASRLRQINVDQGRPKQVSILQVSKYPSVQVSQVCKCTSIQVSQVCKYPKYASMQVPAQVSAQVSAQLSAQTNRQTDKQTNRQTD